MLALSKLTTAPEYFKIANRQWGSMQDIDGTALDYENAILKQITSVHIIKNLHRGDLWNDIKETQTEERARTLARLYTVKKIAQSLKNEEYFLSNLMEEFEQLGDNHQLITIMNYNKWLKYGQWITRQFVSEDPEILQRWRYMDDFINSKEQQHRDKIDNALHNLENDLFDNDTVTDTIEFIQDDKGTVKKSTSTRCECGGRYTEHNLYKHLRTERHIRYNGGTILADKKILCDCGQTINKNQYVRHMQTITHRYKLKLNKEREEKTIELRD